MQSADVNKKCVKRRRFNWQKGRFNWDLVNIISPLILIVVLSWQSTSIVEEFTEKKSRTTQSKNGIDVSASIIRFGPGAFFYTEHEAS